MKLPAEEPANAPHHRRDNASFDDVIAISPAIGAKLARKRQEDRAPNGQDRAMELHDRFGRRKEQDCAGGQSGGSEKHGEQVRKCERSLLCGSIVGHVNALWCINDLRWGAGIFCKLRKANRGESMTCGFAADAGHCFSQAGGIEPGSSGAGMSCASVLNQPSGSPANGRAGWNRTNDNASAPARSGNSNPAV